MAVFLVLHKTSFSLFYTQVCAATGPKPKQDKQKPRITREKTRSALPEWSEKPESVASSRDQNDKKSEMQTSGKGYSAWQLWLASISKAEPSFRKPRKGREGGLAGGELRRVQVTSAWRAPAQISEFMLSTTGSHQVAWNRGETWDHLDFPKLLRCCEESTASGKEGRKTWACARVSGCDVLGEQLGEGRARARRGLWETRSTGDDQTLEEGDAAMIQVLGFRDKRTEPKSSEAICPKSHSLNVWRQNPSRFSLSKSLSLFFFIGGEVLYTAVSVCCTQSGPAVCTQHTHIPTFFGFPPHLGHHGAWAEAPSSAAGPRCLLYTWQCAYVTPSLPAHPTLPSRPGIHAFVLLRSVSLLLLFK